MNQYVTGTVIRELREKNNMTQLQLAEKLGVSDKTVSKWETAKGYPDITLLEPIAGALRVSVAELLSGRAIDNLNVSSNMLRSKFYVCPVCGNVIHSMGESVIHCHGILLSPLSAESSDEKHMIFIERIEDEYYVRIDHSMTKKHYISFIAAVSPDDIQLIRGKVQDQGSQKDLFLLQPRRTVQHKCRQGNRRQRERVRQLQRTKGIGGDRKNAVRIKRSVGRRRCAAFVTDIYNGYIMKLCQLTHD